MPKKTSISTAIDNLITEVDNAIEAEHPSPLGTHAGPLLVEMALQFHPLFFYVYERWESDHWDSPELSPHKLIATPPKAVNARLWQNFQSFLMCSLLQYSDGEAMVQNLARVIEQDPTPGGAAINSICGVFSDAPAQAIERYKKIAGQRNPPAHNGVFGLSALFYALATVKHYPPEKAFLILRDFLISYRKSASEDRFTNTIQTLFTYTAIRSQQVSLSSTNWQAQPVSCPWNSLMRCICLHWLQIEPAAPLLKKLARHSDRAVDAGIHWYHTHANELLQCYEHNSGVAYYDTSESWLVNYIEPQVDWLSQLQQIESISERHTSPARRNSERTERLVWWCFTGKDTIAIQPRIQKLSKNGSWTKGRKVSSHEWQDELFSRSFLSAEDKTLIQILKRDSRFYFSSDYQAGSRIRDIEQLTALANVTTLFQADSYKWEPVGPMQIELAKPHLDIIHHPHRNDITVHIKPVIERSLSPWENDASWHIEWKTPERLVVTHFDNGQKEVCEVLGNDGIQVPADSLNRVMDTLQIMAPMIPVMSNIESDPQAEVTEVDPDCTPHIELSPIEHGLKAQIKLYPLGLQGPPIAPDAEYTNILFNIDGNTHKTTRDLPVEKQRIQQLLNSVPLEESEAQLSPYTWDIDHPALALEILDSLQELGDDVIVDWPRGQRLPTPTRIASSDMSVSLSSKQDWMQIKGELKLSENQVLSMDALLRLMDNASGRFIQLDDGGILALSKQLKSQLNALKGISDNGKVHPLAAVVLDESTTDMLVSTDKAGRKRIDLLREAEALEPAVPKDLKAQLRDYQLEGYQWLVRLSHWGAGACLADDMGLGKTIQSLALLLQRATRGPALVVAPTSVCYYWVDEADRFAGALNVKRVGDGDRKKLIQSCGAGDVLICSYGLLQNEIETLGKVQWATVIADEAQSFKNSNTKRSKAMMMLDADFRMITTGTPIENHLGELWNLFRFINPGLLGSKDKFNEKFATPIEAHNNEQVREQLKTLLRPFILRRLKREVLTELPARTEITQLIEFTSEEAAFYEAIRRQSVERLSKNDLEGDQRFQILAEITRMRQACCHPKLIIDNPPVDSAKLRAFIEIIKELRDNGHRALVFSQFVGHLSLIREYLDKQNISYQYLDGSTPAAKRKTAVDRFQNGKGELFLISLKAGGSGLNLTAADYVIHMDPWWNPAVEDQASDRAHRIGQTRPVTIYRLVMKDTIEEKIVALHAQKRDLADGLLEGTDSGVRLSVEDLRKLLADP